MNKSIAGSTEVSTNNYETLSNTMFLTEKEKKQQKLKEYRKDKASKSRMIKQDKYQGLRYYKD